MFSFTHPQVIPNLYGFLQTAEHKRWLRNVEDFWRMLVTVAIDFHSNFAP